MRKIKVGVIGVGYLGQHHVRIFSELPNVELVGIVDINEKRAKEMASLYQVPTCTTDYRDLLGKVEAVSIVTPTSTHFKIAKDFLEKGIHIFVEKPVTQTLEEAEKLVELASGKDLVFQVGHIERFNGAVQQLKNIILNPYYVKCERLGPFEPRVADVGVVLDLMIHDVDILLNLVEDEIAEIYSVGQSVVSKFEDIALAQILFKNGCFASILASRVSQKKLRTLTIIQKDSYVFLDYSTQDIEIHRRATSAYLLTPEEIRYSQESFVEHLSIQKDNPLKLEILHFINCINGKENPVVDNKQDLKTLEVTLKIVEQINKRNERI